LLHARRPETHRIEGGANLARIGALREPQLDHRATVEIDTVIDARIEEEHDRGGAEDRRDDQPGEAAAHEADRAVGGQPDKRPEGHDDLPF
jgi:hypothetical protein